MVHTTALHPEPLESVADQMTDPPEEPTGPLTRLHDFMYILSELERAVELGGIEWDAASADVAQRSLDRLAAIMQRIAAGFRHH
jgi:hypothetical protein